MPSAVDVAKRELVKVLKLLAAKYNIVMGYGGQATTRSWCVPSFGIDRDACEARFAALTARGI